MQKSKQFQLSIMAHMFGAVLESPFLILTVRKSSRPFDPPCPLLRLVLTSKSDIKTAVDFADPSQPLDKRQFAAISRA